MILGFIKTMKANTIFLASLIVIIISSCATKQEGKHLFILSGQSNMVGLNPEESFTPLIEEKLGEVYEASLIGLYDQLSNDLKRNDIYFINGRLSDFDMLNEKYPHWTMIRDIQAKVAESDPHFGWIDTDDLNDGLNRNEKEIINDLHMSAKGYVIMGKRFADTALQLISNNK